MGLLFPHLQNKDMNLKGRYEEQARERTESTRSRPSARTSVSHDYHDGSRYVGWAHLKCFCAPRAFSLEAVLRGRWELLLGSRYKRENLKLREIT